MFVVLNYILVGCPWLLTGTTIASTTNEFEAIDRSSRIIAEIMKRSEIIYTTSDIVIAFLIKNFLKQWTRLGKTNHAYRFHNIFLENTEDKTS